MLRRAFFSNSKKLQWHDNMHLSSVYTDYSFYSAHNSAALATAIPFVCLSVRPSHAGIQSK